MQGTMNREDVQQWLGKTLIDRGGDRIGRVDDVYFDSQTGRPEWAQVHTGLIGRRAHFVPLEAFGMVDESTLSVPWDATQVKEAPAIEPEGELTQADEQQLYQHYGLDYSKAHSATGLPEGRGQQQPRMEAPPMGPEAARDAMTRSEEEVSIRTVRRPTELVRLRKHIVTEDVHRTVPVVHEEAHVEHIPITEENIGKATQGPDLKEDTYEVTLESEEPVVEKRVVPKERVRLEKDQVTEERQVDEQLRKEQIEFEHSRK